jgi:hypothetical protein
MRCKLRGLEGVTGWNGFVANNGSRAIAHKNLLNVRKIPWVG